MQVTTDSALALGNAALRETAHATAIRAYLNKALATNAADICGLVPMLENNLEMARDAHIANRRLLLQDGIAPRVAVCAWDVGHPSTHQTLELAHVYTQANAVTEIIGAVLSNPAEGAWASMQGTRHPLRPLVVRDSNQYLRHALKFVVQRPYDLVHLSTIRGSTRTLGLIYELVWGSRVLWDSGDFGAQDAEALIADLPQTTPILNWGGRLSPLLQGDIENFVLNCTS